MSKAPIQFDESFKQTLGLPLRLQIAALGEGLRIGQGAECQRLALRLIEVAGFGRGGMAEKTLGPVELLTGLSDRWRARHGDRALSALAMGWSNLDADMRRLGVALGRKRWISAVKVMGEDSDWEVRVEALKIAMDTGDPGFGVMVCSMLGDEHSKVRLAADKALIGLVLGMFGHLDAAMLGEEFAAIRDRVRTPLLGDLGVLELERCAMLSAIADAAWSFASHRCRSPLLASLLLMDRRGGTAIERRAFEKMRRLLSERNHPSHMPIRTVLRTTAAPILRERALRWLVIDPISGVAAARLEVAESMAEHRAVLDQMHLCVRPMRGQALKKVRIATRQMDGAVELESRAPMLDRGGDGDGYGLLEPSSKRGYIRWVSMVDVDGSVRRRALERVMADGDAMVRLHGCCVAHALDLVDYLYDVHEAVGRHAANRWSSVGSAAPMVGSASWTRRMQTGRVNERSGLAWVRRVAQEEVERLSMEMPWVPASRLAARRLYHTDPAKFVRCVREMLHQPARREAGLGMILALGLESRFEMDLVSLAEGTGFGGVGGIGGVDARVGASLVRGLSGIDSVGARRAVERGLESDDQRVVANAIESVHTPVEVLAEYKGDAHHRVRSSAIRRMVLSGGEAGLVAGAAEDLSAMLHDSRVMHRLAGVWAAQRVMEPKAMGRLRKEFGGWREMVMSLNEMTLHEDDDAVRGRADQCVHRMLVSQRALELGDGICP